MESAFLTKAGSRKPEVTMICWRAAASMQHCMGCSSTPEQRYRHVGSILAQFDLVRCCGAALVADAAGHSLRRRIEIPAPRVRAALGAVDAPVRPGDWRRPVNCRGTR